MKQRTRGKLSPSPIPGPSKPLDTFLFCVFHESMKMTAHSSVIGAAEITVLKQRYTVYLRRAANAAGSYVLAGVAGPALPGANLVTKWFGAISAAQKDTLVQGLQEMSRAADDYIVNGKRSERHIEWCQVAGTEHHDLNTFAAAYAFGVVNLNRHFTLRIYAGRGLTARPLGWKANTMFHELSHRILRTADVVLANGTTAYGTANCLALVAENIPGALNNASNWAFFINECNGDVTDEA